MRKELNDPARRVEPPELSEMGRSELVGGELRAMLLGSRPVDYALLVALAGLLALAAWLIRRRARAAMLAAEAANGR